METIVSLNVNRQVRLKSRPVGIPQADHFEIVETNVPQLRDGQFLVRNEYLSVEPAMRGWVNAVANYSTPVGIGEVMRSFAAGKVIASRHRGYAEGDAVMGMLGWQDYALSDGASITRKVKETDLPLSLSLGVLGLNGVTAYFGLLDVGQPRPGDTVVVSTAAGSVGSAVGQIAKLMGCHSVAITGGPIKTQICLEEFGYDAAIDYKAHENLKEPLAAACPRGVDVYFDNTAGAISDTVMAQLAMRARVVICGTASVASWDPPPLGPRVERHILVKRAQISAILAFDYQHRCEEAIGRLANWVRDGRLRYREEIADGIENCPDAIAGLYRGENLGKRLIRLNG
jgi:NADPH-dependent curcumin reductase CurA